MTTKKEWTLTALNSAMKENLKACTTQLERSMCETICKKEIQDKAFKIRKYRKLTPGEEAVLLSL